MACSNHFVDGVPTQQNQNPTINLGYDKPPKRVRRELIRHYATCPQETVQAAEPEHDSVSQSSFSQTPSEVEENDKQCSHCDEKDFILESRVNDLISERDALQKEILKADAESTESKNHRSRRSIKAIFREVNQK